MGIRIVQLGSSRRPGEGRRSRTVRRPPRGVSKTRFATLNFYDVWLPMLSPSAKLVLAAKSAREARAWQAFARKYRSEMAKPAPARTLDLLAALSRSTNFSVGCYCENESRCHRSILRDLLVGRGATIDPPDVRVK